VGEMQSTKQEKNFDLEPHARRIEKPWGYEIHWVPDDAPYMGKVLHVDAGKRLSLQAHDKKQETWFLLSGRAVAIRENNLGEMVETELEPGKGYSTQLNQKHRLVAITDTDVLEVSTREEGTTYRYEDDFQRPDETPEQRAIERS
jgi:mannose-6-phosphate isomerase